MPPRPPDDDNPWADVIAQVRSALDEAHITDPATHEALVDGLKTALDSLGELGMLFGKDEPPAERTPEVTVVEGGRSHDGEAPPDRPRPDLRVAEEPTEDDPITETGRPVVASVRVVRRGEREPTVSLEAEGRIRCDGPEAWQTVFRGERPWPYRVACTAGALRVALDGVTADRVAAGQSLDVEARLVRVAAEEGAATGAYARLASRGDGR